MTPFHYVLTYNVPAFGVRGTCRGNVDLPPGATRSGLLADLLQQMATEQRCSPGQIVIDFWSVERDALVPGVSA